MERFGVLSVSRLFAYIIWKRLYINPPNLRFPVFEENFKTNFFGFEIVGRQIKIILLSSIFLIL